MEFETLPNRNPNLKPFLLYTPLSITLPSSRSIQIFGGDIVRFVSCYTLFEECRLPDDNWDQVGEVGVDEEGIHDSVGV